MIELKFPRLLVYFQEASAAILLPLLSEEQDHIQLPGLVYRPRELKPRVTCGNILLSLQPSSYSLYYLQTYVLLRFLSGLGFAHPVVKGFVLNVKTSWV